MTTEASTQPQPDPATQARLAALRERRATSQEGTRQPAETGRGRRHHAATGARILAGSLSATVALGLISLMAGSDTGAATTGSAVPPPPEPVVTVVRSNTGTGPTTVALPTVVAAPPVAASTAAVVSSSQAS